MEVEEVQRLWGMLYADDAVIVSRSSEGPDRMMTVILTTCSAFELTVSEAKTETSCTCRVKWGEGVAHHQPTRYTNKRSSLCTWARSHRRRQITQDRESAASSEGLGVLPAVQDGTPRLPECALTCG